MKAATQSKTIRDANVIEWLGGYLPLVLLVGVMVMESRGLLPLNGYLEMVKGCLGALGVAGVSGARWAKYRRYRTSEPVAKRR